MISGLRDLARRGLPRRFVLAASVAALLVPVGVAKGTNIWYSGGFWIHQHTRNYTLSNGIDESQAMWDAARAAQIEWNQDTILDVPSASHANSRIALGDGYFGNTGWSGLAESSYHATHSHARYNLTYTSNFNSIEKRALGCQEMGHVFGLGHGGGDCMAFTYFSNYSRYVLQHSIDEISFMYSGSH